MSGPDVPPTPPPEVPEEFAAAYQEAYERALAEQKRGEQATTGSHRAPGHWPHGHRGHPHREHDQEEAEDTAPLGGAHADWGTGKDQAEGIGVGGLVGEPIEEPDPEPAGAAADEGWTEYAVPSAFDTFRSSRWFVPALLVLAVLVLVLGAYGVGRIFATGVDEAAPVAGQTGTPSVPASEPSAGHSGHSGRATHRPSKPNKTGRKSGHRAHAVWKGPVSAVPVASAQAGCTAPSSVDAAGHPVTYEPANAIDGQADTTWRCPGKAIGKTLVLHLGGDVAVGAVGLVPGYAKTDPVSGANRYAENNRITEVRWALGDGRTVVQHLSGSAADRSLRTIRVPRTETDTITLQVLAVQEGPRDTTCVSEVRVAKAG